MTNPPQCSTWNVHSGLTFSETPGLDGHITIRDRFYRLGGQTVALVLNLIEPKSIGFPNTVGLTGALRIVRLPPNVPRGTLGLVDDASVWDVLEE